MNKKVEQFIAWYQEQGRVEGFPDQHFIHGEWVASRLGGTMESIDPGTGKPFHVFAAGSSEDVADAVASAARALDGAWGRMLPSARGAILLRCAALIRENATQLALAEC